MRLALAGIIALTICPLSLASAVADESRILALEDARNQAQLHHDAAALDNLLPHSFIYTDYDGTVMNKEQFLADLKDPSYQASLVVNENVRVFTYNGAAVVVGTYHTKGKYKGRPFEHWGRFTDTWVFENGLWQCVASHTTLVKK